MESPRYPTHPSRCLHPTSRGIAPSHGNSGVLIAAKFGWMLDAMDFMLYTMAVGQLRMQRVRRRHGRHARHRDARHVGRRRHALRVCRRSLRPDTRADGHDLIFSLASLGAATSQSVMQLLFWRAVLGIGMGGEWASGAVLVSETGRRISATSHQHHAVGMGARLHDGLDLRRDHPRRAVSRRRRLAMALRRRRHPGVLHAVDSTLRPRTGIVDAASPKAGGRSFAVIFGRTLIGRTPLIIALGSAVQFANWGLFFWLPAFLARPVEQGGAGMGVVGSLPWIIPVQLGA